MIIQLKIREAIKRLARQRHEQRLRDEDYVFAKSEKGIFFLYSAANYLEEEKREIRPEVRQWRWD